MHERTPGPRPVSPWARAANWCYRLQTLIMAGCLVVMMVLLFGNVTLRYVFNSGITVSDEVSRLAFVWLIFIGAVLAMRDGQHIGMNMLSERLGRRARQGVHIGLQLLVLWVLWLLARGSWQQTIIGMDTRLPVTGLPMAVFNAASLYAAVAMALLTIIDLGRSLFGRQADEAIGADPSL